MVLALTLKGHDWVEDTLLETSAAMFSPTSRHTYLGQVVEASGRTFAKKGIRDYTTGQHEYSRQGGMDTAGKVGALSAAAGMLTAAGTSELTSLRVGDVLSLGGLNFSDASKRQSFGTYDITAIRHSFNHSGHYTNRFEALPEGTQHPLGANSFETAYCPDQRGRVTDNADPMGLGRVKVQFPWQRESSQTTPWIKTPTPYGGSGKGFYFVPEKEEEVLVGFEGNNPEKPYVIGGGFNASAKSGFADADNNIKAIRTRSGHLIELDDSDGAEKITIKDKNENLFSIDTTSNNITIFSNNDVNVNSENNITVTAKESMIFTAKNIKIGAEENIDLSTGKDFTNSVGENHNAMSKNQNVIVEENSTLDAKVQETIADEITLDSKQKNLTLASGKTVDIQSKEKVKLF